MSLNLKGIFTSLLRENNWSQKMSKHELEKVYSEIERKVANEPPPKFAIMGKTGVGKSSTLNALFNAGLAISHTKACTQEATSIQINFDKLEGAKGALIVVDMPGLGESRAKEPEHLKIYEDVLREVDVALWVIDAHDREMESIQRNLEDNLRQMNEQLINNLVIAINKFDLLSPFDWHPYANIPSERQEAHMNQRIADITQKIKEVLPNWNGSVVGFSAEKRYNLPQLFATMLDAVPLKRQWVVASRKAIADFLELVHPSMLPTTEKSIGTEVSQKNSSKIKASDLLAELSPQEFATISSNPEALRKWLLTHGL
jgi:uncharacterized protein